MNHESLKRRTPMNNENDGSLKRRRRGVKVREDFDDDDFGDHCDDNNRKSRRYNVSDDEKLSQSPMPTVSAGHCSYLTHGMASPVLSTVISRLD